MSNLLHKQNETFFIDLSLLVSTDLFVMDQIYRYLYRMNDKNDMFYSLLETVESIGGYDKLGALIQTKSHINPLCEYMNDPNVEIANEYYNGILFDDSYTQDSYYPNLDLTNIGRALSTLAKDTNFNTIYVSTPTINKPLFNHIMSLISNKNKWNFVVGSKEEFFYENECNNYFINDINDLHMLTRKKHLIEGNIYIPEYSFNMNPEVPLLLNTPIESKVLNDTYNLRIHSIHLPIF